MKHLTALALASVIGFGPGATPVQQKTVEAALQPVADRTPAPAFSLADASGRMRRLADYRGTPVVVNLWATDCGGCKIELPSFVTLSRRYQGRVTVVGISLDIMYEDLKSAADGWARVTPFAASHGLTYPILLDDGSAEKAFTVTALPATYLVDRAGRTAATYIGIVDSRSLDANIKTLLTER